MFVSGFTFVRNAVKFDYPVKESILSLLPLVDELIVCLGNSEDTTAELIQSINSPKIKIVPSVWDDSLREGGKVLAVETDKAFQAVSPQADWCIYLQADEVIHENDYSVIRDAMEEFKSDAKVEGLLFNYIHFYGSYLYVGSSRKWYRHEVRIVRNDKKIHSYKDAQGFRKDDRPLNVKKIKARIFHYGWVKNPAHQTEKQKSFHRLWHSDEKVKAKVKEELFDYSEIDSLEEFTSTHPTPMKSRIENMDWVFYYDTRQNKLSLKNKVLQFVEKQTGKRLFEYRNYRVI
ncbi:MAG: glycosyltransferase family 2 protein [Bacteroidetes bacterium]|nr:glycosyltransferase family 2 protein [Bacteroidota bacterium]